MIIRPYDTERDADAVKRIWRETGWISTDEDAKAFDVAQPGCTSWVAEIDGAAECYVANTAGTVRHGSADLPYVGVAGVTTSYVARRQGHATRVTARAIAEDVARGAIVAGLGMFEQGFYDRLGFGTGAYDNRFAFDPARLHLPGDARMRPPRRLSPTDAAAMHANRLARRRGHGSISLLAPEITRAESMWGGPAFGLGYFDGPAGELTHHVFIRVRDRENGPYDLAWMAYETRAQFLELMAVIRSLGDQVNCFRMMETAGVQLAPFVDRPFVQRRTTKGSSLAQDFLIVPWYQTRICDVPKCLAATSLPAGPVRFNLEVTDPIERHLDDEAPWRGAGGSFIVELGPSSSAEAGRDAALPTMRTTINAFSRLWLGVRRPSALAMTDPIDAPDELIQALDETLRVREPRADWDF